MWREGKMAGLMVVCLVVLAVSTAQAQRASDLVQRSYRTMDEGRIEQAKRMFIDAVQSQAGDTLALEGLATTLYLTDDFARAKRTLNILLRRDDQSAYAHALLGTVYARQGDYSAAASSLRRATRLEPRRASFHNNLGVVLLELEDNAGAEDAFRSALRADSRYAAAHYNLAALLAMQGGRGNLRAARRHYDDALRGGFPRDPRLDDLL